MKKKTRSRRFAAALTAFLLAVTPVPFGEMGFSSGIAMAADAEELTADDTADKGEKSSDGDENTAVGENSGSDDKNSSENEPAEEWFTDDTDDLPDSDELFAEYVDSVFYSDTGYTTFSNPMMGYESLTDSEKEIYDALKSAFIEIANGERTSTVVRVESTSWIYHKGTNSFGNINRALLTDLPYELYWYDKTVGAGFSYYYGEDKETGVAPFTFRFSVAKAYAGKEDYTTDTAKTGAAVKAAANANKVVENYSGLSDFDKLDGYREYICDAVEYNNKAASTANYPYGDPWQLIYAFDNDPTTNIVCEGYSKAFQYLCDLSSFKNSSIYSTIVTGTMSGGGHMWNIVSINGVSYTVDITNCDSGTVGYPDKLFLKGMKDPTGDGFTAAAGGKSIRYLYYDDVKNIYSADFLKVSDEDYKQSAESATSCFIDLKGDALYFRIDGEKTDVKSLEVCSTQKVEICADVKDYMAHCSLTVADKNTKQIYTIANEMILSDNGTYFSYDLFENGSFFIPEPSEYDIILNGDGMSDEEKANYVELNIEDGISVYPYNSKTGEPDRNTVISNGDYYPVYRNVLIEAPSEKLSSGFLFVNGVQKDVNVVGDLFTAEQVMTTSKDGVTYIKISKGYQFSFGDGIHAAVDGCGITSSCVIEEGAIIDISVHIRDYMNKKLFFSGNAVEPTLNGDVEYTYSYTVDKVGAIVELLDYPWSAERLSEYVKIEAESDFLIYPYNKQDNYAVMRNQLYDGDYYPKGESLVIRVPESARGGRNVLINGVTVQGEVNDDGDYQIWAYPIAEDTAETTLTIELESAVSVIISKDGGKAVKSGFDSVKAALAYIKNKDNDGADCTLVFNKEITLTSLAVPTNINSLTLTNKNGCKVNFNMTTLNIPVDTTFNIMGDGENVKDITISVAAGKKLSYSVFPHYGGTVTVKGTKTSVLNINEFLTLGGINTFGEVNVAEDAAVSVEGKVAGVAKFSGALWLKDPAYSAVITNFVKGTVRLYDHNGKNAKVTVGDVEESLNVELVDPNTTSETAVESGRTILWAGSAKDFTNKITVANTTASGGALSAFLYGREIKAECGDAVTVSDGTFSKGYPNLDLAFKAITDPSKEYTVTLNDYFTVTKLTLPKTAAKITFDGKGGLNLNMTSLSVPTNVVFRTPVYGTNSRPLAVSVAAGKTLDITAKLSNIGAVKGTRSSELHINKDNTFASLATFGKVVIGEDIQLTVTGNISSVNSLSGEVALPNAKSTAVFTAIDEAKLRLTDTNGALAKVTVSEVKTKLTVEITDSEGETIKLAGGRKILNAGGKALDLEKIVISNVSTLDNELTPFLYGREVRAEYAHAVKVQNGSDENFYPNLDLAFKAMTDPNGIYEVYLNEDIEASKLTFPKKAELISFAGEGSLKLNMTALTVPVNMEFAVPVIGTNAKPLAVSVAAAKKLTFSNTVENIGAVKGTRTSSLCVNSHITVGSVATFGNINAAGLKNDGILEVTGNVSAVGNLTGTLRLSGIRSTAVVTNTELALLEIVDVNGQSAKVTVTNVMDHNLQIRFVDENGDEIGIGAGKSILWLGGRNDISDDIKLLNKTKYGSEYYLALYGKEIRADVNTAVEVGDEKESTYFESLEKAFEFINKKKTAADYTIILNENVSASKLTLPKKASALTFKGKGSLNLNMTSLSVPMDVTFLTDVNGTNAKPLAISVAAGKKLTFGEESSASNIGAVRGTRSSYFENSCEITVGSLSTFGDVHANEKLSVSGNISGISYFAGTLEAANESGKATVSGISIEGGSDVILTQMNGVLPKMTVAGLFDNEPVNIKIVDGDGNTVVVPSGKTILSSSAKYDISSMIKIVNSSAASEGELKAKLVGKDIKAVNELAVRLFADENEVAAYTTIEEAFAAVNKLNNKKAKYIIELNDDIYVTKFTMPTKAASIDINGNDHTMWFNNIASVSTSGNVRFKRVTIENTKNFTISARGTLGFESTVSEYVSAIRGASKSELRMEKSSFTFADKNGNVQDAKITGFGKVTNV